MRSLAPILLVLLSTFNASAAIKVEPAQPQAGVTFQITSSGFWRDACTPAASDVFLPGAGRIVITYELKSGPCGSSVATPYSAPAEIPGLAPGSYRVDMRLIDNGLQPFGTAQIEVNGTIARLLTSVDPAVGGTSGSGVITIPCPTSNCSGAQVMFGETPSPQVVVDGSSIRALTPAHARGLVDVTVRIGADEYRRPSSYTFLAPGELETILLPSLTDQEIGGAFGSRWRTEHGVFNGNGVDLEPFVDFMHVEWQCPILCPGLPTLPAKRVTPVPTMFNFTRPPNWLLHVRRWASPQLSYALRVRDLSRQSQTWGTELPVVRASEFTSRVQLFDVPLQDRFRQSLRIYALPHGTTCCNEITARFYSIETGALLHETTTTLHHAANSIATLQSPNLGSPDFPIQPETAQIDSLAAIPALAGHERVRIELESNRRLWAYVSVTNNETQHVTVVSPQ